MVMNEHDKLSDTELEALFEAARDTAPMPSQNLWEQVHQDALALMPEPGGIAIPAPITQGPVAGLIDAIGGWISLAGLTTATLVGVWIGFVNPDVLNESAIAGILPGFNASESFDLEDLEPGFSGLSAILEEG